MNIERIAGKYIETIQAIDICRENSYFEPAIRLLYCAIDSLSWLYSNQTNVDKRKVREEYETWVDTFLLPELKKHGCECTATELYFARCSQLHTFSAIAKNQKNIKVVAYVLGNNEHFEKVVHDLPKIEEFSNGTKFVLIRAEHLVNSFIEATHTFFRLIEENETLHSKVIAKADNYYTPMDFRKLNFEVI